MRDGETERLRDWEKSLSQKVIKSLVTDVVCFSIVLRPLSPKRKRAMDVKNAGRRRSKSKMLSQALQGACV